MKTRIAVLAFAMLMPLSAFSADLSCLTVPKNDELYSQAGSFNKQQFREEMIGQQEDPKQDLMGCALSVTQGGSPGDAVKGNCGCKKAVEKLCKFNKKKKRIEAKDGANVAFCVPFAPWNL